MITFRPKYGRLGEIMWMTYGMFYICIENNIPLSQIFINRRRVGYDYYMNKSYPILENQEIFQNIEWCLKDDMEPEEYHTQRFGLVLYNTFKRHNILGTYLVPDRDLILADYWYVPVYRRLFHQLFKPKRMVERLRKVHSNIDFDKSCSLHVRRGDFIKIGEDKELLEKFRWARGKTPVSIDAICQALDEKLSSGVDRIICLSDDIPWCKKNLEKKYKDKIVFIQGQKPCEDMMVIGMCRRHILTNDSQFNETGILLSDDQSVKIPQVEIR